MPFKETTLAYLKRCIFPSFSALTKLAKEEKVDTSVPFLKTNDPDSIYNIGKRTLNDLGGEDKFINSNSAVVYSGDDTDLNNINHAEVLEEAIEQINDLNLDTRPKKKLTDVQKDPKLAYEIWQSDPSSTNFSNVLKSLEPTIKYTLAANSSLGDSLIETRAKILAAKAIKKYDGEFGTSLPTYVSRQLQKLTREVRELRNPIKIPERFAYEAAAIVKAEEDFIEKYDKEPTVEQLADATGMPIKQIAKVRSQFLKQVSEGNYFTNAGDEDNAGGESVASVSDLSNKSVDYENEALDYVYHTLSPKAQKVLEYTTGFGGSDILTPLEISNRLKMSRSQVSRIQGNIAAKVYDIQQSLSNVYSK